MTAENFDIGDRVLISPDLTGLDAWTEGYVIEVEHNMFNGIVIAAKTLNNNIFFGREELFKAINAEELCLQ